MQANWIGECSGCYFDFKLKVNLCSLLGFYSFIIAAFFQSQAVHQVLLPLLCFLFFISSFLCTDCWFSSWLLCSHLCFYLKGNTKGINNVILVFVVTAVCSSLWCHNQALVSSKLSRAVVYYIIYFRGTLINSLHPGVIIYVHKDTVICLMAIIPYRKLCDL